MTTSGYRLSVSTHPQDANVALRTGRKAAVDRIPEHGIDLRSSAGQWPRLAVALVDLRQLMAHDLGSQSRYYY